MRCPGLAHASPGAPQRPAGDQGQAEGHGGDGDPVDLHARAVRHQPGRRADAHAVAGGAVGAGVAEEPAADAERQARQQRPQGRREAAQDREQRERPATKWSL